ncbi:MAG TPA: phage portal protein, partial [Terracidiphilus sp.]|nr:phage portal protein [Terracidiphilus sp.]
MNMPNAVRGALRRIAGPSFLKLQWPLRRPPTAPDIKAAGAKSGTSTGPQEGPVGDSGSARRTVPLPTMFTPGAPTLTAPSNSGRLSTNWGGLARAGVMPKPTPVNLRRFAEMPIARKAINTIKDRVAGMQWRIQPRHGRVLEELPNAAGRIAALTLNFEQPNPQDSFRSFIEQVLEDVLVGGYGAIELDLSGDPARPLVMWPVDGASIRIRSDWDGSPTTSHYVQMATFLPGQEITLADEELSYIRLNPRTHTPFGLGKLEVAFETIHEFLCAHRFASRLASNSVVQYALWLQNLSPQHHERLIRWWQD